MITTGIVTGRKTNGFFIQTPDAGDSDPQTSQGLFVFTGSAPAVVAGDAVTARGTASEFFGLTQLESSLPGDVTVDSSGNIVPAAVTLTPAILDPDGPPDQLERYESMRMHADSLDLGRADQRVRRNLDRAPWRGAADARAGHRASRCRCRRTPRPV